MSCGRSLPKRELLRLVRGEDGGVRPDASARAHGRGAYLCGEPECAASLDSPRALARSFRAPVTIDQETIDLVQEWQRSASTR